MAQAPITPTVLDDTNIDRVWLNSYILAHQIATGVGIATTAGQMTYATAARTLANLDYPGSDSLLVALTANTAPQWQALPLPTTQGGTGNSYTDLAALRTAIGGSVAAGAIGTTELADDGVTSAKIADDAVDTPQIADDAIENAQIANLAVDTPQLAAAAVETAKVANSAITTAKIANDAVTIAKMAGFYFLTGEQQQSYNESWTTIDSNATGKLVEILGTLIVQASTQSGLDTATGDVHAITDAYAFDDIADGTNGQTLETALYLKRSGSSLQFRVYGGSSAWVRYRIFMAVL